jgi:hypothetical protein
MSEFASAVTAVEMAIKALGLEGSVSVQMDSEAQTIILDEKAVITFPGGSSINASALGEVGFGSEAGTYFGGSEGIVPTRSIVTGNDVVEAVIEAVSHVIAEQARGFLHTVFEAVDDEVELDA